MDKSDACRWTAAGRNIVPDADVTQTRHFVPETLMYANPQMEYNIKEAASEKQAGKTMFVCATTSGGQIPKLRR